MRAWKENAQRGIHVLLVLAAIGDVAMLAYVSYARHLIETSPLFFRNSSSTNASAPTDGYSAAGVKVAFKSEPTRGWAIRYAAKDCEYCRADEPQWNGLKAQLVEKGYRIYVIPPAAQDAYPEDAPQLSNATEFAYVNVGWIRKYRFTATPTTLLFNGAGKMIWSHVGKMSKDDPKSALISVALSGRGSK